MSPEEVIDLMLHPREESEIRARRHQIHYQRTGGIDNTLKTEISNFISNSNDLLVYQLIVSSLSFHEDPRPLSHHLIFNYGFIIFLVPHLLWISVFSLKFFDLLM